MFKSCIHFRTNTFDILSHLADRQTTDGRYIHVRLLTYFHNFSLHHVSPTYMICHEREALVKRNEHFKIISYTCIFLSKVRNVLDFRFSLKCVYLFCKFHHSNIFSKIFLKYLIANKNSQIGTTLNYRSKQFFISLLPQNILRIFKHLPKWRSLYMRETLYRHCKFSAN